LIHFYKSVILFQMICYDSLSVSRSKVFLLIIIQSQPCIDVDNHLRSFQRQRQTEIQTADEDVSSLNLTRFQKEDTEELDFQNWLQEKKNLNLHIETICKKYSKDVKMDLPSQSFMFDSKHNLLFCRNAKVGTTSWLKNFLMISDQNQKQLSGKINGGNLHSIVPELFKLPAALRKYSELRNLVEKSISFSVVRHPFERLVSAYQDKVIDRRDKHYAYVTKKLDFQYGGVNFRNFIQMILDDSERNCRSPAHCGLDKHWKPFISRCGYCDAPYNFIVKAESFRQDQKFLGKMANVTFAETESHVSSGGSTKSLAKKYFSELKTNTVKKLYHLYKVDFQLFQYSPDLYIQYSKKTI